ncbi:MAG TPA: Ig-like domain-containing protein, partial [Candidatus Limnocylindrales bacterium]
DYAVSDGNGGTAVAHVTIDLECVNDAPVGVADAGMVEQGSGPADYDVLDNDTDAEDDELSLVDVSVSGAQGTASVTAGDEVRFTPNPSFNGQAVITYTLTDGDLEAEGTLTVTVGPDVDAPVVATPTVAFGVGRVNQTAPLKTSWSAFDAGVGVASYDVQVSIAGAAFKPVYSGPATSFTKLYPFKKALVWRVRATDGEGNTSAWKHSARRKIVPFQEHHRKVKYTGAWAHVVTKAASGRGYEFSTDAGDKAKAKFKGRSVLYVAPRTRLSGWVKVYVDGALIGRYKLKHGTVVQGKIVARFSWATNGKHKIRIVNDRDGKQTNMDAFIVLK